MTDIAATVRPATGLTALLRHARYVIGENPVTGLAFGLFVLIIVAALIGPLIVPYDPLASDTAAALQPPSAGIGSAPTSSAAIFSAASSSRRGSISPSRSPRWRWSS